MFNELRRWNKQNIKNYVEIFIKANVSKIKKKRKKKLYFQNSKNIVGITIKPQFPKNPNIIINNDFKKSIKELSLSLSNKINILNK